MANESDKESRSEYEQRFTKLEMQAIDISWKMSILMADLESKFGPFYDFGGSISMIGFIRKIES